MSVTRDMSGFGSTRFVLKNPLILKVVKNQWDRRGARARGRGESALGRRDFRPNGRVLYGAARPSRQRCRNGRRADRIRLVSRAIRRSHVFVHRVKNEGMNERNHIKIRGGKRAKDINAV